MQGQVLSQMPDHDQRKMADQSTKRSFANHILPCRVYAPPHDLNPVIMKPLLDLLFYSVNQVITAFAADPQWRLQGQPSFIGVLHTWSQTILDHFHLHGLVPDRALSKDRTRWTPSRTNYLFRTKSLVKAFKGVYISGLKQLYAQDELKFPGDTAVFESPDKFARLVKTLQRKKWSGYAKSFCSGPKKVLEYLGRYTHRVAISNYRIKSFKNGKVIFTWKDRADNNATRKMCLGAEEFIRRFLLHVLPKGFRKIRYFGFLSPRNKTKNIT